MLPWGSMRGRICLSMSLSCWAFLTLGGCKHGSGQEEGGESQTSSNESPTDALCPEHSSVDDCCCFGRLKSGYGLDTACPSSTLCPLVGLQCEKGLEDCAVKSPGADVDCVLQALVERKRGLVEWGKTSLTAAWGTSEFTERGNLYISGDDAFMVVHNFDTERTRIEDISRATLKPPEYFKECLTQASLEARMLCVENALELPAAELCVEAFESPFTLNRPLP